MPVDAIGATSGTPSIPTVEAPKQTLDSEVFLELLVTQLRNQDPSSPMDTAQMIQQTTQLATMEQLTRLTSLTEEAFSLQMRSAAADLIGREVTYTDADGVEQTGIAGSVSYAGQIPTVTVGTEKVALDAISGLTAAS